MPAQTASEFLRGPVPSESGLGIGLYQVARHAETCGFALTMLRKELDHLQVFNCARYRLTIGQTEAWVGKGRPVD